MNALQMLQKEAESRSFDTPPVGPIVAAALAGGRRRVRRRIVAYSVPAVAAAGMAAVTVASVDGGQRVTRPASLATAAAPSPVINPAVGGVEVTVLPDSYQLAATRAPVSEVPGAPCFVTSGLHFLPAGESQADGPKSWARDIEVSVDQGPYRDGTLPILTDPVGQVVESPYSGPGTVHGVFRDLRVTLAPQLWATVRVRDLPVSTLRSIVSGLQLKAAPRVQGGC